MNQDAPRLLAVDFGEARIGLAGTDDLGLMAHPLETVASHPRPAALERIAHVAAARRAARVIVGLPLRADGTEGPAAEKIRKFATALQKHLPDGMEIAFQDEYGTTTQAQEEMRSAGRTSRNFRTVIDQAAAVNILQDYMRATQPQLLPEWEDD